MMKVKRIGGLCSLVVGLTLVFAAGAQAAAPTPGATYTGVLWESSNAVDGSYFGEYGGSLEFDVSADGTQVTRLVANDVDARHGFGGACTPMDGAITAPVPIVVPPGYDSDYFRFYKDADNSGEVTFLDGGFDRPNEASGRIEVRQQQGPANCYTGTTFAGNIYFTATTGGGCTASQQYLDAQAKVAKLSTTVAALEPKVKAASEARTHAGKKLDKAKGKLANAEGKKAKAKAKKALKKAAAKALEAKHVSNKLSRRLVKKRAELNAANTNFAAVCA